MTDNRRIQARKLPKRFSSFARRIDRRRLAELERGRRARIEKAQVPLSKLQDLEVPWLLLTPLNAAVEGKGRLEFANPTYVGLSSIELAAFDAVYEKATPVGGETVRGTVSLALEEMPGKALVELSVHASVPGSASPVFEVETDLEHQTHQVENGTPDVITVVARSFVWIRLQLAGQTKDKPMGEGGSWAFFEAKVTPLP